MRLQLDKYDVQTLQRLARKEGIAELSDKLGWYLEGWSPNADHSDLVEQIRTLVGLSADAEDIRRCFTKLREWKPGFFPEVTDEDLEEWGETRESLSDAPFFSEAYLYTLMGKEEARTILALLATFAESAGIPREEQWRM